MADLTTLYLSGTGDDAKIMAEIVYARQLADDLKKVVDQCEGWTSLSGTLEDMIDELRRTADLDEEHEFPTAKEQRDSAIEDRVTTGNVYKDASFITGLVLGRGDV